jgi:PIN domain nuclease of toxin-antitoxin system
VGSVEVILLDTHSLVWFDFALPQLGSTSRNAIDEALAQGAAAISAITFWECALLHEKGRIVLRLPPEDLRTDVINAGFMELPLDGSIAITSVSLDLRIKDPADRFIVATALAFDATLVTADQRLLGWPGSLKRQDARL